MRCNKEDLSNPYNSITIAELSHNRQGLNENIISEANDVLYNISSKNSFEKYDKEICSIKIKDLNNEEQYDKFFTDQHNSANIKLIHQPVPCMYPHTIFRIILNGEIVTFDNYKTGLKKLNKLRIIIKEELASMIYTETLSQSN